MGAGQSLYGPALPAFARLYGIGVGAAGLLVSAHWVGTGFGVAAMARLARRITPRLALGVMAAGASLVAASPRLWLTLLGALVFGAGYGASTVIYNRRFMQAFGVQGAPMLSLLNAMFGIGAIAAPLVFVATGSRTGAAFGAVAAVAALGALALGFASRGSPRRGAATPPPAVAANFRPHWGILAFGATAVGAEATLIGLGPTALIAAGVGEARAAEYLSLFFVMFLGVRLVLVALSALVPAFTLFTAALVIAAACAGLATLTAPAWAFVAMGVSAGMFFPLFYVTASRLMGDDDRVGPYAIGAGLSGGVLAPLAMGALMARTGGAAFFPALAVAMAATALCALAVRGRMNRP